MLVSQRTQNNIEFVVTAVEGYVVGFDYTHPATPISFSVPSKDIAFAALSAATEKLLKAIISLSPAMHAFCMSGY
jgi:hypothetical protein